MELLIPPGVSLDIKKLLCSFIYGRLCLVVVRILAIISDVIVSINLFRTNNFLLLLNNHFHLRE